MQILSTLEAEVPGRDRCTGPMIAEATSFTGQGEQWAGFCLCEHFIPYKSLNDTEEAWTLPLQGQIFRVKSSWIPL